MPSPLAYYRRSIQGLPRDVWLLSLVMLVHRSGTMVVPFLGLYLTTQEGFTMAAAGRILAAFGVGSVLGITAGGRWADRLGHRPVILGSLFSSGVCLILVGQVHGAWPLALVVGAAGFTADAMRPAMSAAVAVSAPPDRRAGAFALLRLAINIAMTLGPVVGGILARYSYSWLFWIDGTTALLAGAIVFRVMKRSPPPPPRARIGSAWSDVLADGPALRFLVLSCLFPLIIFQVFSTLPLFLERERGFGEDVIGMVLATNTVLIILAEMPLVHAVRKHSPLRVIAVGGIFLGLGFGLLPWAHSTLAIIGTIALWTTAEMLTFPVAMAWISSRAEDHNRGAFMAAFALTGGLPAILAPMLGTWTYENFGARTLWLTCLVLGLLASAGFWRLAARDGQSPLDPGDAKEQ